MTNQSTNETNEPTNQPTETNEPTIVTPLVRVKYSAVLSKMCQHGKMDTKTSPTQGFIGLPSDLSKEFSATWYRFF